MTHLLLRLNRLARCLTNKAPGSVRSVEGTSARMQPSASIAIFLSGMRGILPLHKLKQAENGRASWSLLLLACWVGWLQLLFAGILPLAVVEWVKATWGRGLGAIAQILWLIWVYYGSRLVIAWFKRQYGLNKE